MTVWFDIAAIAVPLLASGLLGAAVRGPLPAAALPLLFALFVSSLTLGYVAGAHGDALADAAAVGGTLAAAVALATAVCARDAQLAAAGGLGEAALLAGLPRSPQARWRKFERDLWAHIAAHRPGHGASPDDA